MQGIIPESQGLGVVNIHHYGLNIIVKNIAVRGFRLRHAVQSRLELRQHNLTAFIRAVNSVAGRFALVLIYRIAFHICDFELRAGKRFFRRRVQFAYCKTAFQPVEKRERLRRAGLNLNILRRGIENVSADRARLTRNNRDAGFKSVNDNLSVLVRDIASFFRSDIRAAAVTHKERRARNRVRCVRDV